jgi:hypothetical protein
MTCSSSLGSPLPTQVATCFPTALSALSPYTSIYSCISAASITCQYASVCATSTYTVGSEPTDTPAPPAPTNPVLQNPGFESGTTDGWSFVRPRTPFTPEDVSAARTHGGSAFAFRAVFLNDDSHQTVMQQTVSVTPGGNYTLSAWVSSDTPAGGTCLAYLFAPPSVVSGTKVQYFADIAAGAWQQVSYNFQAAASWAVVSIGMACTLKGTSGSQAGKNTLYFDDVVLVTRDT